MPKAWWQATSVLAVIALLVAACGALAGATPSKTSDGAQLEVYAASSLTDGFRALAAAYEREKRIALTLSFDSSAALRTRIEQGAPADVLASADQDNATRLVEDRLAAGEPTVFASNALAIVVPNGDRAVVASPLDLSKPGVRIVLANDEVPIARYATRLLEHLARLHDAPPHFLSDVRDNVVSGEDNVRAVLAKVELGEADAGIVYETDARSSPRVQMIALPADVNVAATYSAVAVARDGVGASAQRVANARDFVRWLVSAGAQQILARAGFRPPP